MRHANTQLVPLFPYYGPGAIVYSGALFRGGPGYDVGHFFHYNTVDEISFVWVRTARCSRPDGSWRSRTSTASTASCVIPSQPTASSS